MCVQPVDNICSFPTMDTTIMRSRILSNGGGLISNSNNNLVSSSHTTSNSQSQSSTSNCIYFLEFKSNLALLDFSTDFLLQRKKLIQNNQNNQNTTMNTTSSVPSVKCNNLRNNTLNSNNSPLDLSVNSTTNSNSTCNTTTTNTTTGSLGSKVIKTKRRKIRRSDEEILQDNLEYLNTSGFYWGRMSSETASKILDKSPIGTFLVRDSQDARFLYTLSVQTPRGPTSIRIKYNELGFSLDGNTALPSFQSVPQLVEYFIEKGGGKIWLENSGRFFSPVYLSKPQRKQVNSLTHLCRVALNKNSHKAKEIAENKQKIAEKRDKIAAESMQNLHKHPEINFQNPQDQMTKYPEDPEIIVDDMPNSDENNNVQIQIQLLQYPPSILPYLREYPFRI